MECTKIKNKPPLLLPSSENIFVSKTSGFDAMFPDMQIGKWQQLVTSSKVLSSCFSWKRVSTTFSVSLYSTSFQLFPVYVLLMSSQLEHRMNQWVKESYSQALSLFPPDCFSTSGNQWIKIQSLIWGIMYITFFHSLCNIMTTNQSVFDVDRLNFQLGGLTLLQISMYNLIMLFICKYTCDVNCLFKLPIATYHGTKRAMLVVRRQTNVNCQFYSF